MNETTILVFVILVSLWAVSLLLLKNYPVESGLSWKAVPLSFFGVAWLGFGITFILRFLFLVWDPVYFQTTNFPIWQLTPEVISRTFFFLTLFWIFFCLAFSFLVFWAPQMPPGLLLEMDHLASLDKVPLLDAVAIISVFLSIITNRGLVPAALLTPLGRLASLCAIPLTVAWILYVRGYPIGLRRFIYLVPLAINYLLSPFRASLLAMVLCIMIPFFQFRKRVSFYKILTGSLIFLLASTVLTNAYRAYKWGGPGRKLEQESLAVQWETWKSDPGKSPWVRVAKRFHCFDSMGLTVYSVPVIFPYSNRNVISEFIVTSFVPRAILDTKARYARGRKFSTSIWSLNMQGVGKRQSSPIAPSMPGDLYSIHGVPMIIVGGLIFGLIVGLLENWLRASTPVVKCILLSLFWLNVAEAIEQDFVLAMATMIQYVIVVFFGFFIIRFFMEYGIKSKSVLSKRT
jgi:hypothetical protein